MTVISCVYMYLIHNYALTYTGVTGFFHPPSIWLGGIPLGLLNTPAELPDSLFRSIRGCLSDFTYITSMLTLDPTAFIGNRSASLRSVVIAYIHVRVRGLSLLLYRTHFNVIETDRNRGLYIVHGFRPETENFDFGKQ